MGDRRGRNARRAWLILAAFVAGAGLARAEAPWWRLERMAYKPLPTGTLIEIDTADTRSVQRARRLAGFMQMPEFTAEARGAYAAQCPEGRYAGLFYDLISGVTGPACADATPLSPDRAAAICGVLWQRRGTLLTMRGRALFEPPYTVVSVRGSRVVCRVGGDA